MNALTISPDQLTFLEDGKPWVWRGVSDFSLYYRYLQGEDIGPVLTDRVRVGANLCRVLGMWDTLGGWPQNFHPADYGDAYFNKLRTFLDVCAAAGLRVEFCVFTNVDYIEPFINNTAAQVAHWQRVGVSCGDKTNLLLQVSNQPGHSGNHMDVLAFGMIAGFPQILCCRENPMEGANPVQPNLSYAAYCSKRDPFMGTFEVGYSMANIVFGYPDPNHAIWPGTGCVSIVDETPHALEFGPWADAGRWRQLARSLCFRGTAGGTFHSQDGIFSVPFSPLQRNCAVEFCGNLPTP